MANISLTGICADLDVDGIQAQASPPSEFEGTEMHHLHRPLDMFRWHSSASDKFHFLGEEVTGRSVSQGSDHLYPLV